MHLSFLPNHLTSTTLPSPTRLLPLLSICRVGIASDRNAGNDVIRQLKKSASFGSLATISIHCGDDGRRHAAVRRGGAVAMVEGEMDDASYMRRCVELARTAVGRTSPNPMVGCVIVKDGMVVGEGFHPKAGQPHAEVFALRDAGTLAENATTYVSLEPCNHYGRTPPCTEALIRAKVKRVVVGMLDPNPIVASKGVERLRESGIDVTVGVEEALCRELNESYIHRMTTGRPFIALRYTLSISGGVLNQLGEGADEPGGYYSQLLQEYDGVVISSCSLTSSCTLPASRESGASQPLHIIIVRSGKSPLYLPTPNIETGTRSIIFAERSTVLDPVTESNLRQQGIETVILDSIKLSPIVEYCMNQGLCSLLLDLGGDLEDFSELFTEGVKKGLLQKVVMEVHPGCDNSLDNSVLKLGKKSLRLKNMRCRMSKESVVVEGYIA